MKIAVVGTGYIGGILGRALANSGQEVVFGSRTGEPDAEVVGESSATVESIADALVDPDVVILAIPGTAMADFASEHGAALAGRLVIDATNQMDTPLSNCRAALPTSVRYARAFNTLGGENMRDPVVDGVVADMFFSTSADDRSTVETLIEGVGLHPIYIGEDKEALLDGLFHLWIELAYIQGHGRRLALKLIEETETPAS